MTLAKRLLLAALLTALAIPISLLIVAPVSLESQIVLGVAAIIVVMMLKPFAARLEARMLLLGTAAFIVLRYMSWRVQHTLPDPGLSADFVAAVALLLLEVYTVAIFMLNAFINADPIVREAPPLLSRHDLPSVDILVPSYNEPAEMLSFTLSAAKNIEYPKELLRVVLCDDGGTDQRCNSDDPELAAKSRERRAALQQLCADLGVVYTTRERNEHAKAGNLSAALEDSESELVVVFDADHVPTRDFLANTVGYFAADPDLALVQTPHFFLNKDPIERNLGLSDRCPPENEMFYGCIHRGLDRWDGAFFCGSAALLRRSALDDVGGFSGETITEDAETTVELHSKGWKSLYVDRAMIAGLQPETFASMVQQRGRWATGMLQILLLKNPLFRRGLSFGQRMCYMNSMGFWLFPVIRLGFLVAPLLYLFFGLEVFVTDFESAIAYAGSYLVVALMVQSALFSRVRWPLISEVYELAQAPYLVGQIFSTIFRPSGAEFKVTAKDETLDSDYLSPIYRPLLMVFALTAAGVAALGYRWVAFPEDHGILTVVGFWAVFNFLTCAFALAAVAERRQRRAAPRVSLQTPVSIWLEDGSEQEMRGVMFDASMSGVRVDLDLTGRQQRALAQRLEKGATIVVRPHLPNAPEMEHDIYCVVRQLATEKRSLLMGLVFRADQPIAGRETVAYLIFGDSARWEETRAYTRRRSGLTTGILYVVARTLITLPATLTMLVRETLIRAAKSEEQAGRIEHVDLAAFREAIEEVGPGEKTAAPAAQSNAAALGPDIASAAGGAK